MFKVKIHKNLEGNYYNFNLVSIDKSHYLHINISQKDTYIEVSISKSEDGFYFKSPCNEANDLKINPCKNLDETYEYVKKYFINKGYNLHTF